MTYATKTRSNKDRGRGRGNLVAVAHQIRGWFRLNVKCAGKRYPERGWLLRSSFETAPGTVDWLGGILGLVSFWEELQAKFYLCFRWSLALRSWYRPGGMWGQIWVRPSHGLVQACARRSSITLVLGCCTVACAREVESMRAYAKVCLLYRVTRHVAST